MAPPSRFRIVLADDHFVLREGLISLIEEKPGGSGPAMLQFTRLPLSGQSGVPGCFSHGSTAAVFVIRWSGSSCFPLL
jgi:hypothetical protein